MKSDPGRSLSGLEWDRSAVSWPWRLCGAGLVAAACLWTWLSGHFVYGERHAERPILLFLATYGVAWLFFSGAVFLNCRRRPAPLWFVLGVALAARLVLFPSNLIQENDVYRYVLDGRLVAAGLNPYQHTPAELRELPDHPLGEELKRPDAQLVLDRIGFPEIKTVYPPAAQVAFAAGFAAAGWRWEGQRWVFGAVDLVVLALILALLRRFEIHSSWVHLYGWNPLVLKEVTNSVHLDVLVAMFLLAALLLTRIHEQKPGGVWVAGAGGALGLAALCKIYPLILAPAFFIQIRRATGKLRLPLLFSASAVAVTLLGALPFIGIGWESLTAGLRVYAREWRMNEGAFAVISFLPQPRLLSALLVTAFAVLLPWSRKGASTQLLAGNALWILLLWFLFLPAAFPWYALPLLAVAPARPRSAAALAAVVLSGFAALYYLSFYFEYHESPRLWWDAAKAVEHVAVWATLAFGLWCGHKLRRQE